MKRRMLICGLLLALAACDEMSHQRKYDSYEQSGLFHDGKSLQAPPDGTLARDDPALAAALENRPAMSMALLERGQQRFGIYCAPCHDAAGYGHGIIPSRGFPQPPSFHDQRLRDAPSSYFVDVITRGHGVMYSYADRVTPTDRWAIAAYIRALQYSQAASKADLSAADISKLGANP
jgi:mono/diheme cytochrome c family protein